MVTSQTKTRLLQLGNLVNSKQAKWFAAVLVLLLVGILYFVTRLDTIVSSTDENLIDVGEIQIVLNNWGTLHHTGYPLYTILGAIFVKVLNVVGFSPADSPSLFSLIWALIALGLMYLFVLEVTDFVPSAVIAAILMAVGFTFWINATIPEVYSIYVASIVAALLVARRLSRQWSDKGFVGLALILGLAGSHHRLAVFILPAVFIYLAPALWQQRRRLWWLLPVAGLAGAATFLVYLYLPIRDAQGAEFVFGSPATWDGFWRVFIGPNEVTSVGPPPSDVDNYLYRRIVQLFGVLRTELSLVGITLGLFGLVQLVFMRAKRATGLALSITMAISFVVGVAFPIAAVPGNSLLPGVVCLIVGIAQVLVWLSEKRPLYGWIGVAFAILLSLWVAVPTYQKVVSVNHPPDGGRRVLDFVAQIPLSNESLEPVLMIPWGNDYFLAYFARYISEEFSGLTVVDHNADLRAYLAEGRPLYTLDSTFWRFPLPWWDRRLGGHASLATVGPNVVEVSNEPLVALEEIPNQVDTPMGGGISLVGYVIESTGDASMNLLLYFQADDPVSTDYSVSVRLTDQPEIDAAEDILAQRDRVHPVLGWYPTSRWLPGEIVRTFYRLEWDPAEVPTLVEVTLYEQTEPGVFNNLDFIHIEISPP